MYVPGFSCLFGGKEFVADTEFLESSLVSNVVLKQGNKNSFLSSELMMKMRGEDGERLRNDTFVYYRYYAYCFNNFES